MKRLGPRHPLKQTVDKSQDLRPRTVIRAEANVAAGRRSGRDPAPEHLGIRETESVNRLLGIAHDEEIVLSFQ